MLRDKGVDAVDYVAIRDESPLTLGMIEMIQFDVVKIKVGFPMFSWGSNSDGFSKWKGIFWQSRFTKICTYQRIV